MNISLRLKTIASLVSEDAYVLDVGCDHALLPIYILENCKAKEAFACDINDKPLLVAKSNIIKHNLTKKISLYKANGLDNINNKVDTIILSGMGTKLIVDILKKGNLKNIKNIIISSNNDYYELREEVTKLGFYIKDEVLICDKNIYYPIISFTKGRKKYSKKQLKYGPVILIKKGETFSNYINKKIEKNKQIIKKLNYKHIFLKYKLIKEIRIMGKII